MSRRGRINPWFLILGLVVTGGLVAVLASGFGKDPHAVPSVLEGRPAPDFTLVDLDGNSVSLADYAGKPIVLNFWSTWCQPCKVEHPLLLQAPKVFPDTVFLGVIYSDTPEAATRYLKREGKAYAHLVDPNGRVALDYGVAGVPETYFIDTTGTIIYKHAGPLSAPLMREMVAAARGGTP